MIYKGYSLRWSKAQPMCIEVGSGENKGKVPDALNGLFTSRINAMQLIDNYVANKKTKDKPDGETSAESGSK